MADRVYIRHTPADSLLFDAKFGENGSCAIDQTPCKEFNIDPLTGRPISDLTAILRAKDDQAEAIIKGMQEYKADFLPDDISDEVALKYYQPRLCQMPSELAELREYQTRKAVEELKEQKRKEELEALRAEVLKSEEEKKEESKS